MKANKLKQHAQGEAKDGRAMPDPIVQAFEEALGFAKLKILKFDKSKQRPITTNDSTMSIEKFCVILRAKLGAGAVNYPDVFKALHHVGETEEIVERYAKLKRLSVNVGRGEIEIVEGMADLSVYFDVTAQGRDSKFFLADKHHVLSRISGDAYLLANQLSPTQAVGLAKWVIPEYMPRGPLGVSTRVNRNRKEDIFNKYVPPAWKKYDRWNDLPDKLPKLFEELVEHLFPVVEEREYFFSWLYESLFRRAYVYLVLCGPPGVGKNRLKLVIRALHGIENSIDGKKSTLNQRFNSQIPDATVIWFDELQYDLLMENAMKELQNDSISIEKKGVDATRGTKIHASFVISNNKPRDNYIAFDSRKFAPLMLSSKRLEQSLSPGKIDELTKKVEDPNSSTFDVEFLAQIAKWLQKNGRSKKWPNLEYQGPMFWRLAHTSMTQWQKRL